MKTDMNFVKTSREEFAWDPKINITVTATNGVVTLTGRVRRYPDKWEVANLVKCIVGVTGIADEVLDGTTLNDTDLTERVLHALEANVFVPSENNQIFRARRLGHARGCSAMYYQKRCAENATCFTWRERG
jgi:hypothetical protein